LTYPEVTKALGLGIYRYYAVVSWASSETSLASTTLYLKKCEGKGSGWHHYTKPVFTPPNSGDSYTI